MTDGVTDEEWQERIGVWAFTAPLEELRAWNERAIELARQRDQVDLTTRVR